MLFITNLRQFSSACLALLLVAALCAIPVVHAEDGEDDFEFTGIVSSLPNTQGFIGDWIVAGRTLHVTSATRIEQENGSPAVGKIVEVEGVLQMDGSVNATEIEVKDDVANNFEFLEMRNVAHQWVCGSAVGTRGHVFSAVRLAGELVLTRAASIRICFDP